ncbi:hypothetical protein BDY19DRAFT_979620 [Irpex rosettiformis]|uniref:Uncharacterized protein n=1 Tax=Irpex rosettiformis TaxID=378272 RepID=A0ACB8TMR5_9APHY|nr:hypothetical protein BDY19DRAFT_979620 [Irpex rosettiformis]
MLMDTPTPTTASPTTPVFPSPSEVRRKRIAKLSRTLGEIIPPYLVVSTSKRPLGFEEDSAGSALSPTSIDPAPHPCDTRSRSMSVDFSHSSHPPPPPIPPTLFRLRRQVGSVRRECG